VDEVFICPDQSNLLCHHDAIMIARLIQLISNYIKTRAYVLQEKYTSLTQCIWQQVIVRSMYILPTVSVLI
jgi:hypothetical protein